MATALLALARVLVRSFDWGSPALARRSDCPQDRRGDHEGVSGHQHAAVAERSSDGVSRTTMLAYSALGNTDVLGDDAGCHGPISALAMTPTMTSATSRWRLTRKPLARCSPVSGPRPPQPLKRAQSSSDKTRLIPPS